MSIKYKGSLDGSGAVYREFPVNDDMTILENSLVVLASNKVSVAADAAAAGTVLGVAVTPLVTTTATAADVVKVDINPNSIYEMTHVGTATPAIGEKYDFYSAVAFDSDDTTGGYIQVVGNVNASTADVIVINRVFGS
jgi:hypothetical protein